MNGAIADKISAKDISLGEFVTLLVLRLDNERVPMPFQNEEKWHRLFYKLKTEREKQGRPGFFDKLRFDWDGRYPRAQDLSEYLQSLHWNGFISVANPTYDRLSVDQDVKDLGDKARPNVQDEQLEQFLSDTISKASALFRGQ
jgi:hypothetical protein